jgi:hypothetical protein
MTPRQCEIAAESYAACLFAQAGYDVLVQYGANQPHYDLVAEKNGRFLPISVKGSQDGGWMLAVKYKQEGTAYHDAIDRWLAAQRANVIFVFVQFFGVVLGESPRVYVVTPAESEAHENAMRRSRARRALRRLPPPASRIEI